VIGLVIVAFVAVNQLGGRVSGTLSDPGLNYPAGLEDGKAIGRADAPVALDVWEDFQCPICARYSLSVEPVLVARYVQPGILRIVHHDIAILGRGGADDESKLAAAGSACANTQGKYWDYAHWIYANQDGENAGGFLIDRLTSIAAAAGVDTSGFASCVNGAAAVTEVATTTQQAVNLGVNATPTMYVDGKAYVGLKSADELGAIIEAAAAKAAQSPAAVSASPGSSSPSSSASSSGPADSGSASP
jgi:protein-disulfide isomerase